MNYLYSFTTFAAALRPTFVICAFLLSGSLGACSQAENRHFSEISTRELRVSDISRVLSALDLFHQQSIQLVKPAPEYLQKKMSQLLGELDALAVAENFPAAPWLLVKLAEHQRKAIEIATISVDGQYKGIWLSWSEKLLLTLNANRHFFSEIALTQFEKAIEANDASALKTTHELISKLVHPDHERKLVAVLRRVPKGTQAYALTLNLLVTSGGPLARLSIYQRFVAEPDVKLAEAIAKMGLPRASDLVGEHTPLLDSIPFAPTTRPRVMEGINGIVFHDLNNQWKELQNYFEQLQKIPARFALLREKWRSIHEQMESLVSHLEIDHGQKDSLSRDILQTFRSNRAPEDLIYKVNGVEFREGDIILLQTGALGGLWETFTQSGSMLSHLLMVTFGTDGLPYTVEMNFGRMLVAPLDLRSERFTVIRPKNLSAAQRRQIRGSFAAFAQENVSYDFRFNSDDNRRLYCSELAAASMKRAQLKHKPVLFEAASPRSGELLKLAGIDEREFYAQGSYIVSSDFDVIAQQIQTDPGVLIRGQLVLEAFGNHVANSRAVELYRHPDAHQLLALSLLAQTANSETRQAVGPHNFLLVVMTLDRLLHALDGDVYGLMQLHERKNKQSRSRITELKSAIEKSLNDTIPKHLSAVFPPDP